MTMMNDDEKAPRAADPELRMGLAELDLRWYFGGAGRTAAGDMGLRSPMGAQLDAARLGAASTRSIDVDASVDRMDEQIEAVRRWRCVRARLDQLTPRRARALKLSLSEELLPGGLSPVVLLTDMARDLWAREVKTMIRRWVDGTSRAHATADQAHRARMIDPRVRNVTKVLEWTMHDFATSRRRKTADTEREAREAAERWATDDRLLAEHLVRLGRAERALLVEEGRLLADDALNAFAAVDRCWPRRADVSANELSARRCDRCGHRDAARAGEGRAERSRRRRAPEAA